MKPKVAYVIFKLTKPPEAWDWGYKNEKEARKDFERFYENETGPQDFCVAKVTTEFLPVKRASR